jgi:hypothetical protein
VSARIRSAKARSLGQADHALPQVSTARTSRATAAGTGPVKRRTVRRRDIRVRDGVEEAKRHSGFWAYQDAKKGQGLATEETMGEEEKVKSVSWN